MRRLPAEPPAWCSRYIGLPYADRGRDRDGVDCWGLVRLVYSERFGIHLPSLEYASAETPDAVAEEIRRQLAGGEWVETREPRVGDVAIFRIAGEPWHVGMAVSRGRMLHAWKGTSSCIERLDGHAWSSRLERFVRFEGPVRVVGRPRPLHCARIDVEVPAGATIAEMMTGLGVNPGPLTRVSIGDRDIPRHAWRHVRPLAGRLVTVTAAPEGGGGNSGKTAARIVLSIAVIAAAAYVPGLIGLQAGTIAAYGASAAIAVGGTLLVNALIPPPRQRLSESGSGDDLRSPTIQGARNEIRLRSPIPVVLGRHRFAPPYGARPWVEVVGDDEYLRCLFVCGQGPLELSEFKIGETPIEQFEGVQIETRAGYPGEDGLNLYPGTILEDDVGTLLTALGGFVQRTSPIDVDELTVDITFPQGLLELDRSGNRLPRGVQVQIQYRPVGSPDWLDINGSTAAAGSPVDFRQLDMLFRSPEVELGGYEVWTGDTAWSAGGAFGAAKPAYLPGQYFSWMAESYVWVQVEDDYEFSIDGSDACDCHVDGKVAAEWYGSHNPSGVGAPSTSTGGGKNNYTRRLKRGFHTLRIRVESRQASGGAVGVSWRRVSVGFWQVISGSLLYRSVSRFPQGGSEPGMRVTWCRTQGYLSGITTTEARAEPIRRSISWAVPRGQYEVRLRRTTPDSTDSLIVDQVYWTVLRALRNEDPIRVDGLAKVALRIKATDQLNGLIDDFNLVTRSIVPDYDAATGQWELRGSSNPASLYRWVCQGSGNRRPLADDRLDLAELIEWHAETIARGLECNVVVDFKGTVRERLQDICAAGRARFGMRDSKYSVVRDRPQTVPVQHFTPRNSRGFEGRKAFPDLPHALRIAFLNSEKGYQQDERIVLDDQHGLTGDDGVRRDAFGNPTALPEAEIFESLELWGCTHPDQAWRHGRYHLAVMLLRPELYSLTVDFENLVCNAGDMVLVTHDVTEWGQCSGRVHGLYLDSGGNLLGVTLDEQVTMDAGTQYRIRFRLADGTSLVRDVKTVEGVSQLVEFVSAIAVGAQMPAVGDLAMFGEMGQESHELLVKSIQIDRDLSARMTFVDHSPAVHQADQGVIPPFDSGITGDPDYEDRPATPIIESIRSDDFVLLRGPDGSLIPRIVLYLKRSSGVRPIPSVAQVRIRAKPPAGQPVGSWTYLPTTPIDGGTVSVTPVTQGVTYQIMLRVMTSDGRASDWTASIDHTVIGKALPPPDPLGLDVVRLSDGTRRYTWDLGDVPPDIAGAVIRYGPLGSTWETMTPLHDGVLEASPTDLNEPPQGTWLFGMRSSDTSGILSAGVVYVERTLGTPRLEGVAFSQDEAFAGWPGTKTDCWKTFENVLEANGTLTWDQLAGAGAATWASWSRWNLGPKTPIQYQSQVLDAGFVFEFSPDAIGTGDGAILVEISFSSDNVNWSAWQNVVDARAQVVRARYLRARITASFQTIFPVPVIRGLLLLMRAEAREHKLEDLVTSTLDPRWRLGVGDIRLPVPPGYFTRIRSVSLTFNGMGPGWSWELVDRATVDGPRVRVYDQTGAPADATIDAVIRGL